MYMDVAVEPLAMGDFKKLHHEMLAPGRGRVSTTLNIKMFSLNIDDFFQQSARVGWAPYEGDYGDLHTWLMVQVDHIPEADDTITVTPLIRLFKNVHLFEAGINNQGDFKLNYILRY